MFIITISIIILSFILINIREKNYLIIKFYRKAPHDDSLDLGGFVVARVYSNFDYYRKSKFIWLGNQNENNKKIRKLKIINFLLTTNILVLFVMFYYYSFNGVVNGVISDLLLLIFITVSVVIIASNLEN